jgi:very-short-patch-repair endonuclease
VRVSVLVENLLYQIRVMAGLIPEREFVFAPPRRWRFDLAWPEKKIAVEVQGGIFMPAGQGGHNRGAYMELSYEKMNTAALLGWRVLQFGPKAIKSGDAANTIIEALRN